VQWAKGAPQACGVTEQSSEHDTWSSLKHFVGQERSMINRADPNQVQMLLDTFLYHAEQHKDYMTRMEVTTKLAENDQLTPEQEHSVRKALSLAALLPSPKEHEDKSDAPAKPDAD
jgi:hypothetical protein